MQINHNLAALNTSRQLQVNGANTQKSLEKLSSGLRINRAGDDAVGLAISEKMRGQIRGLDQAGRNAQDAISMIQTAEGGLNETHSILQRMRELSVQASNATMQAEDRTAVGDELLALKTEVDRIGTDTQFNGKNILNGDLSTTYDSSSGLQIGATVGSSATIANIDMTKASGSSTYTFSNTAADVTLTFGAKTQTIKVADMAAGDKQSLNFDQLGVKIDLVASGDATGSDIGDSLTTADNVVSEAPKSSASFAIGANEGQTMTVSFSDMRAAKLGGASGVSDLATLITSNDAVSNQDKAQKLITNVDLAITQVSTQRGVLGAAQNRLEHTIANLGTSSENLTAAESRIRDVDMAKEMMEFTKNNILSQAAQAMLAQANQQPQGVLQLLR